MGSFRDLDVYRRSVEWADEIIARGSLLEAEHWLDRAVERGLSRPPRAREKASELGRMLNGLIRHN